MDIGAIIVTVWPWMAALYLLDCFQVVRGGRLLYTGSPASGFRFRGPGLRWTGLMPWDWSTLATREPILLSTRGIYARLDPRPDPIKPPGPQDFTFLPWDEIRDVGTDGRKVLVNGNPVFERSTGVEAGLAARRIAAIAHLPAADRSRAVEKDVAAANAAEAIGAVVESTRGPAAPLLVTSTFLFFLTLAVFPLSLLLRTPVLLLSIESALFVASWLAVPVLWWRAHRVFFPEARAERLEEALVLLLYPVSALHAFGKLTRGLLAPFESTALTVALCPDQAQDTLSREYLRTLFTAASAGSRDFTLLWNLRIKTLAELARREGLPLSRVPALEKEAGGAGGPVCPLCGAVYRDGVRECADCHVPLTRIKSSHPRKRNPLDPVSTKGPAPPPREETGFLQRTAEGNP